MVPIGAAHVGNMEMAREFWRARDRDHQERRDQDPVHQVHPDHGAGVWAPEPINAEADVQERFRQLEARTKDLQDDRSACETASHGARDADACRDVTSTRTSDS